MPDSFKGQCPIACRVPQVTHDEPLAAVGEGLTTARLKRLAVCMTKVSAATDQVRKTLHLRVGCVGSSGSALRDKSALRGNLFFGKDWSSCKSTNSSPADSSPSVSAAFASKSTSLSCSSANSAPATCPDS